MLTCVAASQCVSVHLSLQDFDRGSLYGLEKFWAFHHYSGLPKDSNVEISSKLQHLLQNDYKTLDCFKRENAKRQAEKNNKAGASAPAPVPIKSS